MGLERHVGGVLKRVITSVVDLNVPLLLALAWKDNKSPLLASFVAEVLRFPDVRGSIQAEASGLRSERSTCL